MPTDMTGATAAPDFRILTLMRAAMRPSHEGGAFPIELQSHRKRRRGMRRILREIARPFERLGRLYRRLSRAYAYAPRRLQTGTTPAQTANASDLTQFTASLDALRAQQYSRSADLLPPITAE